jgi:CPA2 family monovalent cation:H+ antiporter-2
MFALGLEFSLRKLVKVGAAASLTAVIESSIMLWLGFLAGRAFGWSAPESLFAGAVIAISAPRSSPRYSMSRGSRRAPQARRRVLIVEDLVAILLMAVLTAISTGRGCRPLLTSSVQLAAFLVALVSLGLLLVRERCG